eukprot:4313494-Amphidinium_carterae.1
MTSGRSCIPLCSALLHIVISKDFASARLTDLWPAVARAGPPESVALGVFNATVPPSLTDAKSRTDGA